MENIKENIHNDFEKLKQSKKDGFDNFYNNNYNIVYRICFSILNDKENSEDITQNIFEKIYKMPIEKMPSEYESSWLYTVSKNECLQFFRNKKANVTSEEFEKIRSNKNEIEDVIDNENYNKLVKKLNKKQEQIVSLKVVSDFTFKEIGQIMSMPTATVQWYYYKSIKSLKLALTNLAMFFVAFIIGIRMQRKELNSVNNKKLNKDSKDFFEAEEQTQITIDDEKDETYMPSNKATYNNIHEDIVQQVESTVGYSEENKIFNATDRGFFCVSGIFLMLSIIFLIIFTKHQQKANKKTSK